MEWLGLGSKRFTTSLVVIAMAVPLVILTLRYQTSIFDRFVEGFPKAGMLPSGKVQNVTTKDLELGPSAQNVTDKGLQAKNSPGSDVGSKNNSLTNTTRDSSRVITRNDADKLLDGLVLASGFDEGSCLSRFQSHLYRKKNAFPHKPSPYLISKLRKYEDLHKRCGPHTRSYRRTMKKLKRSWNSGNGATEMSKCNYIVWTPANGLGNRMVSMAAAFLYAVLTERVLLVEFQNDMVGLFCEPFPNSSWILPKNFPFRNNQGNVETYQSILKKDRENNNSKEISPSVIHLTIKHVKDEHERFFHCDHSQNLLRKVPLLILLSDQYFVPSLFMVPSFNQELIKMFPERDTVFHHLGRYLFLPSNEVWGPITRFYGAYLAKADQRIGLQIRVFNPDLTPYESIMNQTLSCTLKHKILPDFRAEVQDLIVPPWNWKNKTLKSVLVASLYPEYGENLRTMYLTKPTVTGEIISVYQPSHEEHQKFHDNTHNVKALTEIYLLSLCDVLVTSSVSSFGYVAQGLGGLKPWLLYKLLDKDIPDPPCERDFSIEPCFHFPPKHDCMAKVIDDMGKVLPYIRRCVDYKPGVKLVSDYQ